MDRSFYRELAARGLRMPIGADLVLHDESDPEQARMDGRTLGRVIERAARRWNTPLAFPLMDLRLEKLDLLTGFRVAADQSEIYHFTRPLNEAEMALLRDLQDADLCAGSIARNQALSYIASQPDLIPVGMTIGPFSLLTRLLADPIAVTALAGAGVSPKDSGEVRLLWQCLRMAEAAVMRAVKSQIAHGARALVVCEPAACIAFFSPRQIRAGSAIFERLVLEPNLRLKLALDEAGCDLIFHDCGELIDSMVEAFAHRLHPVILSLGNSRRLWEDARLLPRDVVLYGNLPSKLFYSDSAMPVEEVVRRTGELIERMQACGHPHIVGTECDVLFVAEAAHAIRNKVDAMMNAGRTAVNAGVTVREV